jgi:hypothetical protein
MLIENQCGLQTTGKVTDGIWSKLMGGDGPGMLDRCLQLTADFEGHGFQKAVGNFDGAGLTWGIIGFTLKHGEIQKILNEVEQRHPELIIQAFGGLKDQLTKMLSESLAYQLQWADSISLGAGKYRVQQQWEEAFGTLGGFPEVQEVQLERVARYWEIAKRDTERFRLKTEMSIALCFDIAVQNGGVDFGSEEQRIRQWLNANPAASEREVRILIADVIAESSRPEYVEDVRKRKRTIASGEGEVHGSRYSAPDWGITEYGWQPDTPGPS